MKILIATGIYPPESGGPATYAKLLHDELPQMGYDVEIVPFRSVRHLPKIIRHLAYARLILKHGRDADALYAQDTLSVGVPAALANIFLHKKMLVRVPGDHVWEQASQRFGITQNLEDFPVWSWGWNPIIMIMRMLQLAVVRRADLLVAPSEYVRSVVIRWGALPARVHTIYSGVAIPVETKAIDESRVPAHPRIMSVARLVPWKGISALVALPKREPTWQVIIGDDGPLRDTLEKQAKDLNVGKNVTFLGRLPHDEMMGWIAAADVFVLNSAYEGLSHLLIEAMALGVPVVATQVGGNPELIESGKSGILVPAGDTDALHEALSAVLADQNLAHTLSQAAQERAHLFSITKSLEKLHRLLRTV